MVCCLLRAQEMRAVILGLSLEDLQLLIVDPLGGFGDVVKLTLLVCN